MEDQAGPSGSGAGGSGAGGASGCSTGGDLSLASLLMSGGFAVYPLAWCPHLETLTSAWPQTVSVTAPCVECGDRRENWLCLHCNTVLCSRYVNSHGLQHYNNTGQRSHTSIRSLVSSVNRSVGEIGGKNPSKKCEEIHFSELPCPFLPSPLLH